MRINLLSFRVRIWILLVWVRFGLKCIWFGLSFRLNFFCRVRYRFLVYFKQRFRVLVVNMCKPANERIVHEVFITYSYRRVLFPRKRMNSWENKFKFIIPLNSVLQYKFLICIADVAVIFALRLLSNLLTFHIWRNHFNVYIIKSI